MRTLLIALALLLGLSPAWADNVAVTAGAGTTIGCKTVGGVCFTEHILVDGNGAIIGTLSIAGGVTQNGTWTVQPGNTANTTPWLMNVVGGVTQGGAWTVTATGPGGSTPFTGVVPVSPGLVPVQAFLYALNPSTGRYDAMNLDGAENLKVSGGVTPGTGMGTNPLGSPILAEVTTSGSYPNYSASTLQPPIVTVRGETLVMSGLNPVSVAVAAGVTGATTQGATTSGTGGMPMMGDVETATQNYTVGQLRVPLLTSGGTVQTTPTAMPQGGAASSFHLNGGSAVGTNSTLVSTGPHTLYSLTTLATTATSGFLRLYDSASAPNCASATNAKEAFPIPVPSAVPGAAGFTVPINDIGWAFANGIAFCMTGGGTDTDNTGYGNTGTYVSMRYQ